MFESEQVEGEEAVLVGVGVEVEVDVAEDEPGAADDEEDCQRRIFC